MATYIPLNEVKAKLSEMVGRAEDHHEEIIITVHGRPAAVLVSHYQFEAMQETLDILSDKDAVRDLLLEPQRGEDFTLPAGASPEEILDLVKRRQMDIPEPDSGPLWQIQADAARSAQQAKAAATRAQQAASKARKTLSRAVAAKKSGTGVKTVVSSEKSGAMRAKNRKPARKTLSDG